MNKRNSYILKNGSEIAESRIRIARRLQSVETTRHLRKMAVKIRNAVSRLGDMATTVFQVVRGTELR